MARVTSSGLSDVVDERREYNESGDQQSGLSNVLPVTLTAERQGFEPWVPLRGLRFSRPVHNRPNDGSAQQLTENHSAVLPACLPENVETDPELARLVERWPTLPEPIRRAIVAMVEAAG
jgi:hypothetical protein